MLINLKEIMEIAEEKKMAVGAFNCPNLEALEAIIRAAEELKLPVILQFAQCHEPWLKLNIIGPVMVDFARKADVPVCVHLDHGETLEYLQQALDIGFTGIMYDGSTLPYEENLENTGKAVKMAGLVGASVEAELGSMGKRESGSGEAMEDETKIYTDPIKAGEFVRDTGIDALACSFGTTHGIYLEEPRLDYDIIKKVRHETGGIPVVMHGGSGVSDDDYAKAINAGVRKINYFTYMDKAGGNAIVDYVRSLKDGEPAFFSSASMAAREEMYQDIKRAMEVFAKSNKK